MISRLLIPVCIAVLLVGTTAGIYGLVRRTNERDEALAYAMQLGVILEFDPDDEWLVEWFGGRLKGLRRIESIQVTGTRYDDDIPHLGDDGLRRLVPLSEAQLSGLIFEGSDAGLEYAKQFRRLQGIAFSSKRVTEGGVEDFLSQPLLELKSLYFCWTPFNEDMCKRIAQLPELESLTFGHPYSIGNRGAEYLSQAPRLRQLWLPQSTVDDEGVEFLSQSDSIEDLVLHGAPITDEALRHLSCLRTLRYLQVGGCTEITDAGVAHLSALPYLDTLEMSYTQITDASIASFRAMPSLTQVIVWSKETFSDEAREMVTTVWHGVRFE